MARIGVARTDADRSARRLIVVLRLLRLVRTNITAIPSVRVPEQIDWAGLSPLVQPGATPTGIDGGAPGKQRVSLGRTTLIGQGAQHRIEILLISECEWTAAPIVRQVEANRLDHTEAIRRGGTREDGVKIVTLPPSVFWSVDANPGSNAELPASVELIIVARPAAPLSSARADTTLHQSARIPAARMRPESCGKRKMA
jgi:hypothetical protein